MIKYFVEWEKKSQYNYLHQIILDYFNFYYLKLILWSDDEKYFEIRGRIL